MPNPEKTVPVDLMIKRLEEANARAHANEKAATRDKPVSISNDDVPRHSTEQQPQPAIPDRGSSRGGPALSGAIVLYLAACFGVVVWQSRHALPLVQTTTQGLAPSAARMSSEAIARNLASMAQEIEHLKIAQEQMVRDNAAAVEQLRAELSQITRDNATIAEQLRESQEQKVRPTRGRRK